MISGGATVFVIVVNFLLQFVIRKFSMGERHETATKMNISVALKLTVARFLNSSLMLVLVNPDPKQWFNGGNLAYDASMLVTILAFQNPFMDLISYPYYLKKLKICLQKSKGEECSLTQREANILCEGTTIDVANKISNFMNMIMTCMFFSPIIP